MQKGHIAVLGAGSWGTAMALHFAHTGQSVCLWGHHKDHVLSMQKSRSNERHLPHIAFPDALHVSHSLQDTVTHAQHVIIAVPSHAFMSVFLQLTPPTHGISWLTKGIEPVSRKFLSQEVQQRWGTNFPMAMITGPSFAREVALQLPTAMVVASHHTAYAQTLQTLLHHNNIRAYLSDDLIGVECCGAIKNILAIACGISDGLGYGANAQAALITRGLAEMCRFSQHHGAQQQTCMGLAGVGDLVLTCTENQSRNRRFGAQLGQGIPVEYALKHIGQVVEGMHNAPQICQIADDSHIDMPICQVVNQLLKGKITSQQAAMQLIQRPPRSEGI